MDESIRLGRIAGIAVGVNSSVLVVLWLISWSLASLYLPETRPGHSAGAYWATAILAAVAFLSSLLAHELGHSVVARRHGVGVQGITLWLFGGVSKLERGAADPGSELRIALAGPAVSGALAVAFWMLAALADSAGAPGLVVGALWWLGLVNLVLGAFNLIPAAPLDGGRVLRALLWRRSGDAVTSAVQAAGAGRVFGFVLVGLGLLQFAAGAWLGGVWFAFLGLFLVSAARAEQHHAVLSGGLSGRTIGEVMTPDPTSVHADLPLTALLDDVLMAHRFSSFPVSDGAGRPVGLVTMNHVKSVPPAARPTTTVGSICTPLDAAVTAGRDEPALEVLTRMGRSRDGRALVLDRGRVVGILTPTDVVRLSEMAEIVAGR